MVSHDNARGKAIDWAAIKARLNSVANAMNASEQLSPQQARSVMDARAQRLAKVPPTKLDEKDVLEVVLFSICGERCALETRFINEVIREESVTPIPAVGPYFAGVTNLRGQIVVVVNLSPLLDLDRKPSPRCQLLVLGEGSPDFAIIVDEIDQVIRLRRQEVLSLSSGMGNFREIACGCTADARVILDGEALLQFDEFYIEENE